jgi:hypothetical protein
LTCEEKGEATHFLFLSAHPQGKWAESRFYHTR